jgi:alpha-beta hydrolase superfamily lysophospholipase
MKGKALLLVGIIFLVVGCVQTRESVDMGGDKMEGQTIQFDTTDGITIIGTLWKSEETAKAPVILVHQLGRDRGSFFSFAQKLFAKGFTVLAIDVRGHGESIKKGNAEIFFMDFGDEDYQKISDDILKAKEFLKAEKVLVVGASIGANAVLNYSASDSSSLGAVLLSPGLNYKGIDTQESAAQQNVPLLITASKEDEYSMQSSQVIFDRSPLTDKKLILLENAGHGTDMLVSKPDFEQQVIQWLERHSE